MWNKNNFHINSHQGEVIEQRTWQCMEENSLTMSMHVITCKHTINIVWKLELLTITVKETWKSKSYKL